MDPYSYIQLNNIQAGTYAAAISTPVLISLFLGMFVLIVLSALFSASETALSAVNMYEIKEIANQKKKTKKKRQANNVIFLLKDFNGTIAGILIANNVVNIINTSLVTVIFTMLLGETGVIYGILLMSVLIITFSEILPKIFAKRYATKLSLRVSSMVKVIYYVTYPINAFFAKIIKSPDYLSISGYRVLSQQINHLNDEGLIDNEKSSWLINLLKLESAKASDAMVPIKKIHHIHFDYTDKQIMDLFERTRISVFPVLTKNHKKAMGTLKMKDYFVNVNGTKNEKVKWQDLIKEAILFPMNDNIEDMLDTFKEERQHFAVVTKSKTDKTAVGIITVEDIVEEIIGDIYDSDDVLEDDVHQISIDEFVVYEKTNTNTVFTKYLKDIKVPFKLNKKITFGEWMKEHFKIEEFEAGEHYTYQNISIWIKNNEEVKNEFVFEIDIHEKTQQIKK